MHTLYKPQGASLKDVLQNTLSAFEADSYQVKAIYHDKQKVIFSQVLPGQSIEKYLPLLQAKNCEGYNIFIRPIGRQYILLDDLGRNVLASVATIKPCALVETSPDNFQAWIILPTIPPDDESAVNIARHLAERFGADLNAARSGQIGRLAGFTNRKPKYEQQGQYPFVKLHKFAHRLADVNLSGLPPVVYTTQTNTPKHQHQGDRSAYDFQFACKLFEQGKTEQQVIEILGTHSQKAGERGVRYLQKTVERARAKVMRV